MKRSGGVRAFNAGSGAIGLSGHAKQDATELIEALASSKHASTCVVPAQGTANLAAVQRVSLMSANKGFRPMAGGTTQFGQAFLSALAGRNESTVLIPQVASEIAGRPVRFSVILPPNFDSARSPPYPVVAVPTDHGAPETLAQSLLSGDLHARAHAAVAGCGLDEAIVVIAERLDLDGDVANADVQSRLILETELAQYVAEHLNGHAKVRVPSSKSATATSIDTFLRTQPKTKAKKNPPQKNLKLPKVNQLVFDGFEWTKVPNTRNYREAFPTAAFAHQTATIPVDLQKQPANKGTLFVPPIASKSLDKVVQAGVYLPPGYDPESSETYPVLVMLPGKGNPLHIWTSAGQMTSKLDSMMRGDGQKMIVVVAENTDSFWYDYDTHSADFAEGEGRQFESHINELIDYATSSLKGDASRLSIGGISRGGFGAMSIAARHPGKFQSVSAHAALMAFEHDAFNLDRQAQSVSRQGHFGAAGQTCWQALNPADLVRAGAFDAGAPRIFFDCGNDDDISRHHALEMAALLEDRAVEHTFVLTEHEEKPMKHNWATWSRSFESWIAFHQSSYGTAGKTKPHKALRDVGAAALQAHRASKADEWEMVAQTPKLLEQAAQQAESEVAEILPLLTDIRPYEKIYGAANKLQNDCAQLAEMAKLAPIYLKQAQSLFTAKNLSNEMLQFAADAQELREVVIDGVANRYLGTPIDTAAGEPGALLALDNADRLELSEVAKAIPECQPALRKLATLRPELFGKVDSLTGERFSKQLSAFVGDGLVEPPDVAGFVEFLDRMATKRFDWRRGGYSHSVCAAMNTAYNHPGLILDLIRAARTDTPYKVCGVYSGDGCRKLRPHPDLKAGFRPVPRTSDLPAAELGYERGFLRAIVDELAPPSYRLPKDRFAKRADPVAVSLSKLTGQTVRYGYAFGIQTGQDLVDALESQGDEGLAFADVHVSVDDGPWRSLHFPVFYDFDPKTRTVTMHEWRMPPQRLDVDKLSFHVDLERKDGPAIYYREAEALDPFLTPQYQPNWPLGV